MKSNWIETKLESLIELHYGKGLKKKDRKKGSFPVLGSNGIIGLHSEYLVVGPGIVIGRKGTVGALTYIKDNFWPIDTTYYVIPKAKVRLRYIYYLLSTLGLETMNTHSAVPGLNREHVYSLNCNYAESLLEQEAIETILGLIDDKIELNNQMNKNLEVMAQVLFKSWFIKFEPFLNGEFKKTELGMIPKAWKVTNLGNLLKISYGKGLSKNKRIFGKYPVYGSNGIVDYHKDYLLDYQTVIIGRKGSVGSLHLTFKNSWPIDTTYYIESEYERNIIYWFEYLKTLRLEEMNTHTAVPGLNRDNIYSLTILDPPQEIIDEYCKITRIFYKKINFNNDQNQNLSKLRELILPKLLSGRLKLNNPKKFLEEIQHVSQ